MQTGKNGIFDYRNSKRKKLSETLNSSPEELFPATDVSFREDTFERNMNHISNEIDRSQRMLDDLGNKPAREEYYRNSMRNFLVPEDSEQRRRMQFVLSPRGVKEAADDYYESTMRNSFEKNRAAAESAGTDAFSSYMSVPGANPQVAAGRAMRAADPMKVIDKTMGVDDAGRLDDVAGAYARYAGLNPESYKKLALEPALRNRMLDEYVTDNTPVSSPEYMARSMYGNSLFGKMNDWAQTAYSGTDSYRNIGDAGLAKYDAGRLENFASGVGSLLIDSGVFAGFGAVSSKMVGGATSLVKNRLANKLLTSGAAGREGAEAMAKDLIVKNIGSRIAQSSAAQGLTLGNYDLANSVFDDLVHGEDVDGAKAAKAFGKGAGTGILLGAVGTPLREASKGLTGGKKAVASAGVLSAESAVFTLGTELEKASSGVEIEPIDLLNDFGESAATLVAMRMFHWLPQGVNKLNSVGRLKKELRLSDVEAEEVASAGVNPTAFMSSLEKTLNSHSKGIERDVENVKNDYMKLMASPALSAATRSKLLYVVENKLTSTPPVAVDYRVEQLPDGDFLATTFNMNGGKIESKRYSNRNDLDGFLLQNRTELQRNRIGMYENMLVQGYDSQSFFRSAGDYARETGIGIDAISEALYKKANKEPLNTTEQQIIDDVMQRSGYTDSEAGVLLHDLRVKLEKRYGLRDGSLQAAIEKPFYRRGKGEEAALGEYEQILADYTDYIRHGGNKVGNERFSDSPFNGMSNDAIKAIDRENYMQQLRREGVNALNRGAAPDYFADEIGRESISRRIYNSPYNITPEGMYRHSTQKNRELAEEADRISSQLGVRFNVIRDGNDIPADNPNYEKMVKRSGWYDPLKNEITINLSNNRDVRDIRETAVHEAVGHAGFMGLFGKEYADFLEDVYHRGSSEVKRGIEQCMQEEGLNAYEAVDEYISRLATRTANSVEQRSLLQRFKDYIEGTLTRNGLLGRRDGTLSEAKLLDLIERHHLAMRKRKNPSDYRRSLFGDMGSRSTDYTDDSRWGSAVSAVEETADFVPRYRDGLYTNTHYRFIGREGANNLEKDGSGYLKMKLREAMEMKRANYPRRYIKLKTGWELGADYKWRFEIADDMEIIDLIEKNLRYSGNERYAREYYGISHTPPEQRTSLENKVLNHIIYKPNSWDNLVQLQDIIKDKFFFSAYPELRNVPVTFKKLGGELCYYNAKERRLYVDKIAFSSPDFKRELLMPLQRMIQDYENFSRGMSVGRIADQERVDAYENAMFMAELLSAAEETAKGREEFAKEREDFIKRYNMTPEKFLKSYPTLDEYILSNTETGTPLSLQGNVELRNVYSRFDMSPAKRRATLLGTTEDFPRENQIYSVKLYSPAERLRTFLGGPIDLIYKRLNEFESDKRFPRLPNGESPAQSPIQRRDAVREINDISAEIYNKYYNDFHEKIKNKILSKTKERNERFENFSKDKKKGK